MIKVIKRIFDVIFVILIITLALYFVLRIDNRIRIYSVMTGSMEDKIYAGDYILILKQDDYKIGDIVTFTQKGYYVTHRIIKKDGNAITTKGDANNAADKTIDKSQIIGKVIFIGGALNIIIKYKFAIVGLLLTFYLISCYFAKDEEEKENDGNVEIIEVDDKPETKVEETKVEEKNKKEEIVSEIFEEQKEEKPKKKRTTRKSKEDNKGTKSKKKTQKRASKKKEEK